MVFEEAVSLSCDKYYKANWLLELCWHISVSALEEKLFPLSDFGSSYPPLQARSTPESFMNVIFFETWLIKVNCQNSCKALFHMALAFMKIIKETQFDKVPH